MKFNPEKHYLGSLCKRGHEWEGSGKSLRYINNRGCFYCTKLKSIQWKKNNKEKDTAIKRRWHNKKYHTDPQYKKKCIKKAVNSKQKRFKKNPELKKEYNRKRMETWKKKYHSDPKYREHILNQSSKSWKKIYYSNPKQREKELSNNRNRKKIERKFKLPAYLKHCEENKKYFQKKKYWKKILKQSPNLKSIIEAWINYKIAILNLQKQIREELL